MLTCCCGDEQAPFELCPDDTEWSACPTAYVLEFSDFELTNLGNVYVFTTSSSGIVLERPSPVSGGRGSEAWGFQCGPTDSNGECSVEGVSVTKNGSGSAAAGLTVRAELFCENIGLTEVTPSYAAPVYARWQLQIGLSIAVGTRSYDPPLSQLCPLVPMDFVSNGRWWTTGFGTDPGTTLEVR